MKGEKKKAAQALAGVSGGVQSISGLCTRLHLEYSTHCAICQGVDAPIHGKVAGEVWSKHLAAKRHALHKPPAWAVDVQDLEAAERCGAVYLRIWDADNRREWWARLATIRRYGFIVNRGAGPQVALGFGWWRHSRDDAAAIAAEPEEPEGVDEPEPLQLSLFSPIS